MKSDLTLSNLSVWLRRVEPEKRAFIQTKWQYYKWLSPQIALPEKVWLAFIVPTELLENAETKKLRETGLWAFKRPEKFVDIIDPLAPESRLVSLCLLGMLYDLEQEEVHLPYDTYQAWLEVANNFGLWRLRYYLEDALFKNFDAKNYELFESVIAEKIQVDESLVSDISDIVTIACLQSGVKNLIIKNRQKNVYGVYKKVKVKQKNLNEIYDIHGFRLITEQEYDCIKVLEVLHRLWPPFPDRYKDYITSPKSNGYQSLHTTVSCLKRIPVEFQIRTQLMDEIAVSGLANHAEYKKNQ